MSNISQNSLYNNNAEIDISEQNNDIELGYINNPPLHQRKFTSSESTQPQSSKSHFTMKLLDNNKTFIFQCLILSGILIFACSMIAFSNLSDKDKPFYFGIVTTIIGIVSPSPLSITDKKNN